MSRTWPYSPDPRQTLVVRAHPARWYSLLTPLLFSAGFQRYWREAREAEQDEPKEKRVYHPEDEGRQCPPRHAPQCPVARDHICEGGREPVILLHEIPPGPVREEVFVPE